MRVAHCETEKGSRQAKSTGIQSRKRFLSFSSNVKCMLWHCYNASTMERRRGCQERRRESEREKHHRILLAVDYIQLLAGNLLKAYYEPESFCTMCWIVSYSGFAVDFRFRFVRIYFFAIFQTSQFTCPLFLLLLYLFILLFLPEENPTCARNKNATSNGMVFSFSQRFFLQCQK